MISNSKKFVFIHIPKTAGNSIQDALYEYSDDKKVFVNQRQDGIERFEIRNDVFTCVRNPWDRMISYYFSPSRGPQEWDKSRFRDFVNTVKPTTHYIELPSASWQYIFARKKNCFGNVNFYVRYENLQDDFNNVLNHLGIPPVSLPRRNASSRGHYSEYYDSSLKDLVYRRFRDEIGYFGYCFESSHAGQAI